MSSRFDHVVAYDSIPFFFNAEWYSIVCEYCILFIHVFVNWHLGCFYPLAVWKNDAAHCLVAK